MREADDSDEETGRGAPGGGYTDFETYVHEQRETLLRMARRLVGDAGEAQDLVQIALTKTYLSWDRIADRRRLNPYVHRIMVNTRNDWWRTRRIEEIPQAALPDRATEDFAQQYVEVAHLHQVLRTLPPRRRGIVVLRYLESRSTEETARALDMASGTVKSGLRRGLSELRGKMDAAEAL